MSLNHRSSTDMQILPLYVFIKVLFQYVLCLSSSKPLSSIVSVVHNRSFQLNHSGVDDLRDSQSMGVSNILLPGKYVPMLNGLQELLRYMWLIKM
jgi:hypothetical protein